MAMTNEQIKNLLGMVTNVKPDSLDCDGCCEQIAEFAETHLLGKTLQESQQAIQTHLENCHCCQKEFESLLNALKHADQQ